MAEPTEEKKKPRVKVYTAGHCAPCQEIKEMMERGQFSIDGEEGEVDLVDIESEEGFEEASKREDLTSVPTAFKDLKKCEIEIDRENRIVHLRCQDEQKPETTH